MRKGKKYLALTSFSLHYNPLPKDYNEVRRNVWLHLSQRWKTLSRGFEPLTSRLTAECSTN